MSYRFYLAPCGIALGHAGRTLPIAHELSKLGHEVFFSTYGDAYPFVKFSGFNVAEVPSIRMFEKEDGTFDLKRTLALGPKNIYSFLLQLGAELNLISQFKPDVVISDSRLSTVLAARVLNVPSITLLHQLRILIPHVKPIKRKTLKTLKHYSERVGLETLGALWKFSTLILVPDFPPPYTIAKANVVPSKHYRSKVKLIGPIVAKRPENLPSKEVLREKYGLNDRPAIFCAMSGTIPEKRYISSKLVEIFKHFPDSYQIIVSRGLPNNDNRPLKLTSTLQVFNWVIDRFELLKACDLLITRGGHNTVAEAMYFGIPMIIIPTPGHSEHQSIARSVADMGLGIVLQQRDLSHDTLLQAVKRIFSEGYVERSKKIQSEILKYNGLSYVLNKALILAAKASSKS
ncbi:MAG: hypothetical protein DRJ33_00135 [Candidatus Methanomethylicota archaeon]|uniref:Glycosyl transferase family 28 C-terminal domain-containing protein n=1 Tax=Thermoproteota archaeon TaxID=2056631 RepID=A0A497F4A6_9CREN|nr:MAG: hypothetical protein DRJ33_00135 [Candidatus Verstraetearchaeota archaeon]